MKVTNMKRTYCHTCKKAFHYLGINRHVAAHKDKKENCRVTFTHGDTYTYNFSTAAPSANDKE